MDGLIEIIFFLVSFIASIVGAICGIGGGVIIKPVLDSLGVMGVASISFLSGCTVLTMSGYSVFQALKKKENLVDLKVGTPLAIGAAAGGLLGKYLLQTIVENFSNRNHVGAVQAACLFAITLLALVYTIKKEKIKTHQIQNTAVCIMIGLVLGILSSFLGIGGGPVNLVILFYFFSMEIKTAAQNSLYIILFSQITSLILTLTTHTVPEFNLLVLILMVIGGLLGGILGRIINKRIDALVVSKLFNFLMLIILFINVYNFFRFIQ